MYLQNSIIDGGREYKTVGFIDSTAENRGKLQRFGYITLTASDDRFLKKGAVLKAHEFHYFDSTDNGAAFTAKKANGKSWPCIHIKNNCICGYPHIFYPANLDYINKFLSLCDAYKNGGSN